MVRPIRVAISVSGLLLMIAGLIFALQGFGVVGPPSSFMFESSQWVYNGIIIFSVGSVVLGLGVGLRRKPKQ